MEKVDLSFHQVDYNLRFWSKNLGVLLDLLWSP